MTDFTNSELRRLDLTVLLVFLGLLRHRKATVVAAELGLTQSAVSHAVRRLREVFGDPLFLRRPHGMEPTAVALALEAPVGGAVAALRGALGGTRDFDPARAEGVVRLAAFDVEQALIVPGLVERLCAEAPGLRLAVLPLGRAAAVEALADGRADLAVGFFWGLDDQVVPVPLYEQSFCVVGRPEVMGTEATLSLDRYVALPHVLVSPAGDLRGIVDDALAAKGLARRVVASVPQFFPALATVAATGCIATLPEALVRRHGPAMGLVSAIPPVEVRRFTVSALRHRRNARDARLLWVLDRIRAAAGLHVPGEGLQGGADGSTG
jgi:DNA-binding transcriptional LysR family regulator